MKVICPNKFFPKKIITFVIGALVYIGEYHTAVAQIGAASVHGSVVSNEYPQAGLDIVAKNIDNGYIFKTITQKDGTYIFNGLRPGNYQIFIQDKNNKAPDTIILKVGQAVVLDFDMSKIENNNVEEVTVIGSRVKYSSGGEVGTNISLEQINKLPQTTRNFLSFADLAPGVQFTQGQDGSTSIKSGAQGASAINVFIDGVGQKDYVLKGGVSGQDTSRGNPFPQSAIGEYKVITQNYSAEYDQLSSAAIVAVTASGTNEFHGSFFYDFSDESLRKSQISEYKNHKKIAGKQAQYGFNIGGPIIKDKMHFFFAYEGKGNSDPHDVIAGGGYTLATLPANLQSEIGGRAAKFDEDLYFGKIDYLISSEQKIELTTKIRKENELTSIGDANAESYGTDKKNDETRYDLSHNLRTNDWINDIHLTYEDASFNPRPHTLGIGEKFTNNARAAILNIGAGPDYQYKGQSGWGLQEDFSYLAISDHQIKTGFKYKVVELAAKEQQPYNPQYEYNIQYSVTQPYLVKWGAPLEGIGDGSVKADNKQFGIYIQDEWRATERLTINAGLRWDYEESDSFLHYKTPTDVLNGIANWANIKNSDVNINDYISTGNNRKPFKDAWQPRFGFTYALSDNSDVMLFGGIGRAYDRNLFDNLQLEATKATFPTYEVNFDSEDPNRGCDLTTSNCVVWDPKYLTRSNLDQIVSGDKSAGREVFLINNNLKTPYSDQFSFGVRGSLYEQWNAEVSLSRVVSMDGFAWALANRRPDGSFFAPGTTWGAPFGFGIPGFGNTLIAINGIETKANSLFIKLDKPKGDTKWGLSLAYTYTNAKTNRKSGETFALDYPSIDAYGMHDANDLPNHRLIIAGLFDLPGGIDLSAKLNLQSVETFYGQDCRAGWNDCVYRTFKPDSPGFLGYKQLDISLIKNISTGAWLQGSDLTLRLDILNVTNEMNHDGYQDWYGGANESLSPVFGKPTDKLAGPPATVKLGVSWKW